LIQLLIKMDYFTWTNIIEEISLGSISEYLYYVLIFIGIFIGYLFSRPITSWLVSLKTVRLLSYLMNSLFILVILLFMIIMIDELNHLLIYLFKVFLQCLAGFGVALILFKTFWNRRRKV